MKQFSFAITNKYCVIDTVFDDIRVIHYVPYITHCDISGVSKDNQSVFFFYI